MKLERGKALNQQSPLGKPQKITKNYVNARYTNLATMSDEVINQDKEAYKTRNINNYFTTEFKKIFKIYKIDGKLYTKYAEKYVPLRNGEHGFIVSPKGSLYGVYTVGEKANSSEIQNPSFYHSLFRAGQATQTAGFFRYDSSTGKITNFNRNSGHYKPTHDQHLETAKGLMKAGLLDGKALIGGPTNFNGPSIPLNDLINGADASAINPKTEKKVVLPPPLPMPAKEVAPKNKEIAPKTIASTLPLFRPRLNQFKTVKLQINEPINPKITF